MKRAALGLISLLGLLTNMGFAAAQGGVVIDVNRDARKTSIFEDPAVRAKVPPVDWNKARGTPSEAPAPSSKLSPEKPGSVRGGQPNANADAEAKKLFPDAWNKVEDFRGNESSGSDATNQGVDFGTRDVFTQYTENAAGYNTSSPQKAIGKLFTNSGSCSASVISGNSIIVTAAHCCYDRSTRRFNSGYSFYPAYRNNNGPYGSFSWSSQIVLKEWMDTGSRKSDVCLIKLRNNAYNQPVTYYTGWLGRSWNYGFTQNLHAVGYPGNIGNGQLMQLCTAESFQDTCKADTVNMGCSMTLWRKRRTLGKVL